MDGVNLTHNMQSRYIHNIFLALLRSRLSSLLSILDYSMDGFHIYATYKSIELNNQVDIRKRTDRTNQL